MGAAWMRGRSELRARWRSLVVLALLIGIGGGVALTALAGARRTDNAVSQFAAYSLPDNGGFTYGNVLSPPIDAGLGAGLAPVQMSVVHLPQVAAYFRLPEVDLTADRTGRSTSALDIMASPDFDFMHRADRPLMVAGRLPAADRPFDAAVNQLAATDLHLRVGSVLRLYAYSAGQIAALSQHGAGGGGPFSTALGPSAPAGPELSLRITGIFRLPADVNAVEPYAAREHVSYEGKEGLYLPPAFLPRLAGMLGMPVQRLPYLNLAAVRLRHGTADFPAFEAAATKVGHGQVFVGDPGNVVGTTDAASSASRATRVEALSLLIFGLLALVVTGVLVGQGVSRQVVLQIDDYATMRALGANRGQLLATALLPAGITATLGAAFAFVVAIAASPLMPIGLARQAEIHPGVDLDPAILIGATAILAALVMAWCLRSSWQASRPMTDGRAPEDERTSRLAGALGRGLRSPAAGMGVRFALERGRGRHAIPVASALVAAVVAVAALSASLTFGSSLSRLGTSSREQGWNWDVLVGNPSDFTDREADYAAVLSQNPLVGSYSAVAVIAGARQGNAYIDKVPLDTLLSIDLLKGSVHPVLLSGRAPRGLQEVVLARRTLDNLHKKVGDTVPFDVGPPQGTIHLHIVGEMIAPSIGDIFTNSLGDGGWISGDAVRAAQARGQGDPASAGPPGPNFSLFAVRYAPGASSAAAYASLQRQFGPLVLRRLPPEDVINLDSMQELPFIMAALVGLLGAATIGHTLVTSVRRRRQDLAVLKTIGFGRGQVGAAVAWQATSFVVTALVAGIPIGIALGRWAWNVAASEISSTAPAAIPALALVLVVPGALIVANLVAAGPGWVAARVAPAVTLRTD